MTYTDHKTGNDVTNIPRRARLDQMSETERAIFEIAQAVESLGADVRLTDAVVLLQAARDSVADYIDAVEMRRYVSAVPTLGIDARPTEPR
jgi:hypothetical protein